MNPHDINLAVAASFADPFEVRSAFDLHGPAARRTARALGMRIIGRRGYLTKRTPDLAQAMLERVLSAMGGWDHPKVTR